SIDITHDEYIKIKNLDFPDFQDTNLIKIYDISNQMLCFSKCSIISKCAFVSFNGSKCRLLKRYAFRMLVESSKSAYCKNNCDDINGLINYWPIYESQVNDIVEGKDLYAPVNAFTTADRHGNENAAIRLKSGYYRVPEGVYFNGDFTVMAWAKVNKLVSFSRLFDFGVSRSSVLIFLSEAGTGKPGVDVISSKDLFTYSTFNKPVELSKWFHIAAVLKDSILSLYFNCTFQSSHLSNIPTRINRNLNFIGKSNMGNPNADADIDDFKIFNRALNIQEITDECKELF
ncbi:Alginate lyase N-terminal domain-containing, partial [Brachionus plicatilis]